MISNCTFTENVSFKGVAAIKSNKANQIRIMNSDFKGNLAPSMLMLLQSTDRAHICHTKFTDNAASSTTPGFYLQDTALRTTNVTISNSFEYFDYFGRADPSRMLLKYKNDTYFENKVQEHEKDSPGTIPKTSDEIFYEIITKYGSIKELSVAAQKGEAVISGFFLISSGSKLTFDDSKI